MKTIKAIKTKADYKSALARIEELVSLNPKKGSAAYNELDVIGTLVSTYEGIHFQIEAPSSIVAPSH